MDPYGRPYGGVAYNSHKYLRVESATSYLHIQLLKFFLRLCSGWPGRELRENCYKWEGMPHAIYNTFLTIFIFILQIWYLIDNAKRLTFFEMGHMGIAILMNMLSMSRGFTLCLRQKYRDLASRFFDEIHTFHHKDKSDYARKIYLQVYIVCHYYTYFLVGIMVFAAFLFHFVPTGMNFTGNKFNGFDDPINVTFDLSLYTKLPWDPERTFKGFMVAFFLNWYITFLGACSIIMFDLFLAIMIFHLWGHFKILIYELDTFPRPALLNSPEVTGLTKEATMYSESEQREVTKRLKDCILYHRMIKTFVDEMSQIFGIVLFVFYAYHQVSGCLLLLEISQGNRDALFLYVPLAGLMFTALVQMSIVFETIGSMSERLRLEVYCVPWEYMNRKNRSTMQLFIMSSADAIHVKAGGVVPVGVTTMAGILRTSFSYYAILRTMND